MDAANILEIPVIATEQYPKGINCAPVAKVIIIFPGLGNTVKDIDISNAKVFSKTKFSMVIPEVEEILAVGNRKSVVIFGIEVISS